MRRVTPSPRSHHAWKKPAAIREGPSHTHFPHVTLPLARKIIDMDGKCDAYFSADYLVIERLLRPDFAEPYETAEVERAGKEPGETIITKGCPFVYGLTIPKGAPHEEAAVEFLEYFLDPEGGLAILEEMGRATTDE